jgi:predicted methyltransferase
VKSKSTMMQTCFLCLAALVIAGCGGGTDSEQAEQEAPVSQAAPEPAAQDLASLLASDSRAEADRARDAGRKPAEVIAFLGIEPGMNVIDIIGAGGYYTEVLSLAVGPDGHVTAQNPAVVMQMRDGANEKALSERLANNRLPNVSRLDKEMADISAEDGPFDAAFTALNLHDIYNRYGEESAVGTMKLIYSALKPGGVFGVIDHSGLAGNDNSALHRMQKEDAIRVAKAAGFVVEGDSGLLHDHGDDMSQGVFAEGVRGHTHRFLLKLRKPEAD